MLRRIAVILSTVIFAFGILATSILRAASVKYSFSPIGKTVLAASDVKVEINYTLPYPGRILPDDPLWFLKAGRDKAWLILTTNPGRKSEVLLLLADKRLVASKILFERKKPELAFSTLTKAEKYLEEAQRMEAQNRKSGMDTGEFLDKLAKAALKHREVTEEILLLAPEEAKPKVIQIQDYSKKIYKGARDALDAKGLPSPKSPFNGEN